MICLPCAMIAVGFWGCRSVSGRNYVETEHTCPMATSLSTKIHAHLLLNPGYFVLFGRHDRGESGNKAAATRRPSSDSKL